MARASSTTVMVLGAGFTRSYLPKAPLMVDDYDADGFLTDKFAKHEYASRLLALEKSREGGRINIERLMTRLDGGMPIDSVSASRAELEHLLHETHRAFFKKLEIAATEQPFADDIRTFALHCIRYGINCITFNYDDLFDWALTVAGNHEENFWRPSLGYGFAVGGGGPAGVLPVIEDLPSMFLIKLHGSVNWRMRLGQTSSVNPGDVIHWEGWRAGNSWTAPIPSDELLEPDPFFVPPILMKSAISRNPLLKFLWIKAHKILEHARHVIFVGYSLPDTDIASKFLFTEAIHLGSRIDAVVLAKDDDEQMRLDRTYKTLFRRKEVEVHNDDARLWLNSFMSGWSSTS